MTIKMKNLMKNLMKKLFNFRFLISIICTVFFGIFLRLFFSQILDLSVCIDKLDLTNLSFFTIIALFKATINITLDEFLPHSITMGSDKNTAMFMENKSDSNPSKSGTSSASKTGDNSSSKASGSSSKTSGSSGSKVGDNSGSKLGVTKSNAMDNLLENMQGTLKDMLYTSYEIEMIKIRNNVTISKDTNGELVVDVFNATTNKSADEIADKVVDLNLQYLKHLDRYNQLVELDNKLYKGQVGCDFTSSYKVATDKYDKLINK